MEGLGRKVREKSADEAEQMWEDPRPVPLEAAVVDIALRFAFHAVLPTVIKGIGTAVPVLGRGISSGFTALSDLAANGVAYARSMIGGSGDPTVPTIATPVEEAVAVKKWTVREFFLVCQNADKLKNDVEAFPSRVKEFNEAVSSLKAQGLYTGNAEVIGIEVDRFIKSLDYMMTVIQGIISELEVLKLSPGNFGTIMHIQSLIRNDSERIAMGEKPSSDFQNIGLGAIELDDSMIRVLIQFVELALQEGIESNVCKALLKLTELVPDPKLKQVILLIESSIKEYRATK